MLAGKKTVFEFPMVRKSALSLISWFDAGLTNLFWTNKQIFHIVLNYAEGHQMLIHLVFLTAGTIGSKMWKKL